jgi:hypothetical protein
MRFKRKKGGKVAALCFFIYLCLNQPYDGHAVLILKSIIMAKIKFGMFMVDARGKSNGHVFSKNRGGAYVRTKVTPSNPRTSAQMSIRGIFAAISSAWSGLTADARASWNGFVSSYATTDIFGDIRNPSGKNLFQKLNQNLVISGQAQITTCVSPTEVPFANLTTANLSVGGESLDVETLGDTTGSKIVMWATPSLSQGTNFVKNKLRQVEVFDGSAAASFDAGTAYIAKFGLPTVGANIYVGVRVINANGQASPLETIKAVVTA